MSRRTAPLSEAAQAALERLQEAWRAEQDEERRRFDESRRERTLRERAAQGLAVERLSLDELDSAPGGRWRARFVPARPTGPDGLRFGPGAPVELTRDDQTLRGVLAAVRTAGLEVVLDADPPDDAGVGTWTLEPALPAVTFERGRAAIRRLLDGTAPAASRRLCEILLGDAAQGRARARPAVPHFDAELLDDQREAVRRAVEAPEVAVVHGPPGTGKTRTLVEVVRQLVAHDERVLVVASSNAAVDLLTCRLAEAGQEVLRLGHPARVDEAVEPHLLDERVRRSEAAAQARGWLREANVLRRRARSMPRAEARAVWAEARALSRDAQRWVSRVQQALLEQAKVVLTTAAGAGTALLDPPTREACDRPAFDTVVIDEATQLVDPLAWVAIARAERVVLAGDHQQLAPTVLSDRALALDLGRTLFERAVGGEFSHMLRVQHRMSEALQAFPSEACYDGRLVASIEAARRTLDELDVAPDPLRASPVIFLDTAGRGWESERHPDDASLFNTGHAERVTAEVARLASRGVSPGWISVIAAYDAQVRLLRERLETWRSQGLEVGTVDSFQGRENEVVIVDLVRSQEMGGLGFLRDTRRMNVALTRARRALFVLGDGALLGAHPWYAAFIDAAEQQGGWVSTWSDEAEPLG